MKKLGLDHTDKEKCYGRKEKSKYKLEDINLDIDKLHTLSRLKEEGSLSIWA